MPPVLSPPADETGAWLSLVERLVRDQEVAGSNPVAPTILMVNKTPVYAGVFLCFGAGRCPVAPLRIPSDSIGGGVDKRGGQNYRINGAARFWPLSAVAIPFSGVVFRARSCPPP